MKTLKIRLKQSDIISLNGDKCQSNYFTNFDLIFLKQLYFVYVQGINKTVTFDS